MNAKPLWQGNLFHPCLGTMIAEQLPLFEGGLDRMPRKRKPDNALLQWAERERLVWKCGGTTAHCADVWIISFRRLDTAQKIG